MLRLISLVCVFAIAVRAGIAGQSGGSSAASMPAVLRAVLNDDAPNDPVGVSYGGTVIWRSELMKPVMPLTRSQNTGTAQHRGGINHRI